jgi:hypothetical protein
VDVAPQLPNLAACAGRDLLLEILPDFVEPRTRDAGPTPDALFETMASRAAKGVSKPHLYCWEYFLRWRVAEMVRLAYALEAGGIKISGWLIVNEPDGNAPQNARLSRGPGVLDYDVAHTSTGTRGPYAFAFAVTDAADIEVYLNQIKQAATTYDVAAAASGFGMGGTVTIKSSSAAPATGVIVRFGDRLGRFSSHRPAARPIPSLLPSPRTPTSKCASMASSSRATPSRSPPPTAATPGAEL